MWLHAAMLAVALTAAPAHAQRAELDKIIKRRVLANGLEVIVVENHGVPLATVEIDVKNGSFTQSPEYAGLAHMYEHMFFKANEHLPEPDQFIDRAAELGAVFNGRTDEERVAYYMTLPADSLAGGLQAIADALRAPLFLKEEIDRERQVVIGEYDRNESNPFFKLQSAMGKQLYPGQWSRKNVIGDRDVILTVTPEKMREIQRKYYVPNNSVLIVTGDVSPDSVFQLAEKTYGDWARGADPFVADPIPPIPPLQKSEALDHRAACGRGDRPTPVARAKRSRGSECHLRRGRLFGRTQPIQLDAAEEARGYGPLAVDRRQLLHARPRRADHDQRPDHACQVEKRARGARRRDSAIHGAGLLLEVRARCRKGTARGELRVRPGASVQLQPDDRVLVERCGSRVLHGVRRQHGEAESHGPSELRGEVHRR